MIGIARIPVLTQFMMIAALLGSLFLGLLPALLGGLMVYQLVEFGARLLGRVGVIPATGRIILLAIVSLVVVGAVVLGMALFAAEIIEGPDSLIVLMQRMADVIEAGRSYLPPWMLVYLPENIDEFQAMASEWLRENARDLSVIGRDVGGFLFHLVVGMIIGGMIAISPAFQKPGGPLAQSIARRIEFLDTAFRRIVFAQIRISALNTFLTALFLVLVMPIFVGPLPLTKTMIAVTFIVGLLPIIGNLISNTVIVLISLSVSPLAAVSSLVFLIVIHKLEYFINARIIGVQIRSRAWEILLAMLVMESAFGLAGLVAAPIFYAYLKDELIEEKLI